METQTLNYYDATLFHEHASSLADYEPSAVCQPVPGFPSQYTGERVWTGSSMATKEHEWIIVLSDDERDSIIKSLRHFQGLQLDAGALSPETFPLPKDLSNRLKSISHDCYNGRGFAILRGLRPEQFTDEENVLIYGGVSSHVAPVRGFQDVKREQVTCHVLSEEMRAGAKEQKLRPAFTNGRLAFHTDLGDILSLFTIDVSNDGGETMLASSSQIYNELSELRPDLLHEFRKDYAFFHSQNYTTDKTPLVTNASGDKLVFQYSRLPVTGFRDEGANPTLPTPSQKRLEAMAMLEQLAWKNAFPLPRQRGDIAFINNLCMMHARSAFDVDDQGHPMQSRRHLVKLMLRDPELAWDLPSSFDWYQQQIYGPNRENGDREETWQLSLTQTGKAAGERIWAGKGALSNG
jgi:hypothetical protein